MKNIPPALRRALTAFFLEQGAHMDFRIESMALVDRYLGYALTRAGGPRDLKNRDDFLDSLSEEEVGVLKMARARSALEVLMGVLEQFPVPLQVAARSAKRPTRSVVSGPSPSLADQPGGHFMDGGDSCEEVDPSRSRSEDSLGDWEAAFNVLEDSFAIGQYALTTRKSYRGWIRGWKGFCADQAPGDLSSELAAGYLTHLARVKRVSAATQNQAFNALLYFFKHVLNREFNPEGVIRARKTKYVPQTLTREEISAIADRMDERYALLLKLLYGCGLRLGEALELRVHNFDFDMCMLTIHRGKGQKDRTVPLPKVLLTELSDHLANVKCQYRADMNLGFAGAFMPKRGAELHWEHRRRQWAWQFFFPAVRLTKMADTGELRRFHLHANHFSKALKEAVQALGIHKKVSAHTFRHSFASHLLLENYDIKTIQEMLGHSDVRTTMIYLQTVPSRTIKERSSPLDLGG